MATFYLLPPRECLEHAVGQFVNRILPGVPVPESLWACLVEHLVGLPNSQPMQFVIHREDLPGLGSLDRDLVEGFGAEAGDRIVEVGLATSGQNPTVREWVMPVTVSKSLSVR